MSVDVIEQAYYQIHDQLPSLPEPFCYWKKKSSDGRSIPKTLSGDYRPIFNFVYALDLRNNLAELRMCIDYHRSLYSLHKPGLTFGWQHRLVICQMVAGIFEGILLDLFEFLTVRKEENKVLEVLGKQKIENKGFGFGALIDVFSKAGVFDENWQKYLLNLNYLRNTVHPRGLNSEDASFQKNPIVTDSIENLCIRLDKFIELTKEQYK